MPTEVSSELSAMKQVADALEVLEDAARQRVVSWITSRFIGKAANPQVSELGTDFQFGNFAELFDRAAPGSEKEKALVAAFWIHMGQGQEVFPSQALNAELKNLGHGVGNITDALSALIAESPALILQIKKSGKTKQARKSYKLSEAGKRRVREMISTS